MIEKTSQPERSTDSKTPKRPSELWEGWRLEDGLKSFLVNSWSSNCIVMSIWIFGEVCMNTCNNYFSFTNLQASLLKKHHYHHPQSRSSSSWYDSPPHQNNQQPRVWLSWGCRRCTCNTTTTTTTTNQPRVWLSWGRGRSTWTTAQVNRLKDAKASSRPEIPNLCKLFIDRKQSTMYCNDMITLLQGHDVED